MDVYINDVATTSNIPIKTKLKTVEIVISENTNCNKNIDQQLIFSSMILSLYSQLSSQFYF